MSSETNSGHDPFPAIYTRLDVVRVPYVLRLKMVNKCQTQLVLCVLLKLHGTCAILTVMIQSIKTKGLEDTRSPHRTFEIT